MPPRGPKKAEEPARLEPARTEEKPEPKEPPKRAASRARPMWKSTPITGQVKGD